jgi:predicted nucleic acid-binding Zn ribbon protein
MFTFDQVPTANCPRCQMALPPGGTICSYCGLRIAQVRPGVPMQPFAPITSKDRAQRRNRPAPMYFAGVFLFLVCSVLLVLHASGVSLPAPFSSQTPPPKVKTYPLPRGTPLFSDSFFSDASGWNLQSSPGNYTVTLNNGVLGLQVEKNKLLWELLPGERAFSNFTLTVKAMLSSGDQNNGYGVYFRGAPDQETDLATYYRFELYGDGSYAIFKGVRDSSGNTTATKMVNYTLSPAIRKRGEVNQIMIVAKGAALSFVVNGQLLKTITDTSYASGSIALFVANLPQAQPGAQAQFSQLALYPVQV